MSISNEITRLTGLRNSIRTKLIALGIISNSSATLSDCYNGINSVSKQTALTKNGGTVSGAKGYYPNAVSQTVSAADVVSGSATKTENGTFDVTNLANIIINVKPDKCRIFRATVPSLQGNDTWFPVNNGDADIAAKLRSERSKLNVFWYWTGLGSTDASGIKGGFQIGSTDSSSLYGVYMRWAASSPTFGRADQWQPIQFSPSSNAPSSGQCAIDADGKVYIGSHTYMLHAGEVIAVVFWE